MGETGDTGQPAATEWPQIGYYRDGYIRDSLVIRILRGKSFKAEVMNAQLGHICSGREPALAAL